MYIDSIGLIDRLSSPEILGLILCLLVHIFEIIRMWDGLHAFWYWPFKLGE